MKCSVDGVWVHIPCVAWNPQLLFKDIEALCPAEIRPILRQPQLNVCKYCGKRKGVPIKCHCANCINYYHATCAQDAGCILDAEAEGEGVVFTITCPSHTFASGKKSVPPKPMSQNSVIDISDSELSALAHELDEADWDDFATESQAVQRPSTGITSEAKRFCGEGHVPSPTSTSQLR